MVFRLILIIALVLGLSQQARAQTADEVDPAAQTLAISADLLQSMETVQRLVSDLETPIWVLRRELEPAIAALVDRINAEPLSEYSQCRMVLFVRNAELSIRLRSFWISDIIAIYPDLISLTEGCDSENMEQVKQSYASFLLSYGNLSLATSMAEDVIAAEAAYGSITTASASAHKTLGSIAVQERRFDDAESHFEQAGQLYLANPDAPEFDGYLQAELELIEMLTTPQTVNRALDRIRRLSTFVQENELDAVNPRLWMVEANIQSTLGNRAGVKTLLQRVIDADPDESTDFEAHLTLGVLQACDGEGTYPANLVGQVNSSFAGRISLNISLNYHMRVAALFGEFETAIAEGDILATEMAKVCIDDNECGVLGSTSGFALERSTMLASADLHWWTATRLAMAASARQVERAVRLRTVGGETDELFASAQGPNQTAVSFAWAASHSEVRPVMTEHAGQTYRAAFCELDNV